jgi:hypothetical protein
MSKHELTRRAFLRLTGKAAACAAAIFLLPIPYSPGNAEAAENVSSAVGTAEGTAGPYSVRVTISGERVLGIEILTPEAWSLTVHRKAVGNALLQISSQP